MRSLALPALFLSVSAFAAGTPEGVKINGVTYTGAKSVAPPALGKDQLPPELALRLKKIFLFPSIDDLSGALAPKLDEKLANLFSHNTRFETIRDPQVVKALSPDENSYAKAALSPEVHKEAARVTGADTTVLLRTRNVGPDTHMTLELRDAKGNLLFSEEGSVPGSAKLEERWDLIEKLYRGILSRLPFEGTITGRTANTITVDLGTGSMRQNEVVEIARIVSIQRHPLLGTVVGTDYVRTGRAKVTTVDRVLSFAEVIEEYPGEKINPGQKVLRQQASLVHRGGEDDGEKKPRGSSANEDLGENPNGKDKEETPLDKPLKGDFDKSTPRYGKAGANLYYGSLTHDQTTSGSEAAYGASGVGGELEGELWITKNWIVTGDYGFHSANLTGTTGSTLSVGATGYSSFELLAGYRIFPEGMGEGLVLTGSAGYQILKFDIPAIASANLGAKRFAGLFLMVDGDLHFLYNQFISAGFSIAPLSSVTDTASGLGMPNNGTVIGINLSWNYQLMEQFWLKIGMRYDVASTSYDASTSSVADKRFGIGPGLYLTF